MMNYLYFFCALVAVVWGLMLNQTPKSAVEIWQPTFPVQTAVVKQNITVPEKISAESGAATTSAAAAIVVDRTSGKYLLEKNVSEQRSIGSITKLMTALVFLDRKPDWDRVVTVEADDFINGAKKNFIAGEQVKLRDLFAASMIASDNDAARVLARSTGLALPDFVQAMNTKAHSLGLRHSVFVEPTGLLKENISTAEEIIILAREAFSRPEVLAVAGDKEYEFVSESGQAHSFRSTNKLYGSTLNVRTAKTGFIDEAGYCLVAEVENQGRTLLVAVLGSLTDADRFQDVKTLSNWAWSNFRWGH